MSAQHWPKYWDSATDPFPPEGPAPIPFDPNAIRYHTPLEIAASTSEHPDWICRGYSALGAITEVTGKVKASGKTTMLLELGRCILDGQPFLGQPVMTTKVVYVSEQQPGPFREALARAGLLGRGDELRIVFRGDVGHLAWPELVKRVTADAQRDGYGLLVIDTLGKLAQVKEENDAGEGGRVMTPIQNAAHAGLAVIVARHERKSGGEVGESGRGSSAISGDVDIILQLRRPEGHQPRNRRVIETLSRYTETPEKVVVELTEEGYALLGDEEAVTLADALRKVSGLLGGEFDQKPYWTIDELVEETDLNRVAIRRALKELHHRGEVIVSGKGKRGDPHRYALQERVSGQTNGLMWPETNNDPGDGS